MSASISPQDGRKDEDDSRIIPVTINLMMEFKLCKNKKAGMIIA